MKIKENPLGYFSTTAVELKYLCREIDLVDPCKAIQQNDIPIKLIKASGDMRYSHCKISWNSQKCKGEASF